MEKKLPEGWECVELREVTLKTLNVNPRDKFEREFIYIDISSINSSTLTIAEPKTVLIEEAPSRARQLIKSGDTLVSTVRPNLKRIARVSTDFDNQIASTGFSVLRPSKNLDQDYLFYSLIRSEFTEGLISLQRGASYPAVRNSDVFSQEIPLPPLPEQKRIAAKLDELFGHLDELKTKLDRIPALLKNFRQQVLTQAVTGKLTEEWRKGKELESSFYEILETVHREKKKPVRARGQKGIDDKLALFKLPKGWKWIPQLKLVKDGTNAISAGPFGTIFKAKDFRDKGVPIIFLRHVKKEGFNQRKPNFMDKSVWKELHQEYSIYVGELLVTKLGDPPGEATIYPKGIGVSMVTPDVMKSDINQEFALTEYVSYFFNSSICKEFIASISFGMTRLRIDLTMFKSFPIPLPTIKEQTEIVKRVEGLFAVADKIEAQYNSLKTKIDTLPQAILNKAFKGELVPQNPNDEPASVLLERINGIKTGSKKAAKAYKEKETEVSLAAEGKEEYK